MHFPTPHISKKTEKRKASLDSDVRDDEIAIEKKITRTKSKKTKKKKVRTMDHDNMNTTEGKRQISTSPSPSRSTSLRKDSAQESPPTTHPNTTDAQTQTSPDLDTETPTPRRSSRIKNSMHVVADTWSKCRPYIERINGTIMPLEPQGTKAYYARDGVRVD